MTKDVLLNTSSGYDYSFALTVFDGALFFAETNSTDGIELFRSDGTQAGTVPIDLYLGGGSNPRYLTVQNGNLYFAAFNPTVGTELWVSDGTAGGTQALDVAAASASIGPYEIVSVGGKLLFGATDSTNGRELWSSDGTVEGTALLKNICPDNSGACSGWIPND